jgi:hypothetical protein
VNAIKLIDPCMSGNNFLEFLPTLVQVINPSKVFMLDNILHQKVQCVEGVFREHGPRGAPAQSAVLG